MRRRKLWKSDSVTFKLDKILYFTPEELWSTKLKRCPFYFNISDFTSEKSWPCTLTFCGLPLNQWSPEKYIGRHTITFANFETVLSDFSRWQYFYLKIIRFWWVHTQTILLKKNLNSFQKPILHRIFLKKLCHTIRLAHLANGTKSHFGS